LTILLIKLLLIPVLLAAVTLVSRRFGPNVAGWLGSFPIVAGLVLLVITLEQGGPFGAVAAEFALAGLAAAMVFCVVYAHLSNGRPWWLTAAGAFASWALAVGGLALLPSGLLMAAAIGFGALAVAPRLFPALQQVPEARVPHRLELPARMVVGALLAVVSSWLAARYGARLAGYLALFPLVTSVLVTFTHALDGRAAAVVFLAGMARGLWAAAAFCLALALLLARLPIPWAFVAATVVTVLLHALLRPRGPARPGATRAAADGFPTANP
jgi:hypothetical protein